MMQEKTTYSGCVMVRLIVLAVDIESGSNK